MRFVRSMPWLRGMFPPSERPGNDPSHLAEEVQLVTDYWGAGYAFREPQTWFSQVTFIKAADNLIGLLDTTPDGQITRIIKVGIRNASGAAQVVQLTAGLLLYSPDFNVQVPLSTFSNVIIPAGAPNNYFGEILLNYSFNMPGNCRIYVWYGTGDNVQYNANFLAVAAPRGVGIYA